MSQTIQRVAGFRPAQVKTQPSMGYIIEFYIFDPEGEQMVRQRYRVNNMLKTYTSERDRRRAAQALADDINAKLAQGWSPLYETQSPRLCTPLDELRKKYLREKENDGCRGATLQSYSSITGLFVEYTKKMNVPKVSGQFLKEDAVIYMDYISDKGNSARSFNNTAKTLKAFFSWSLEHCYCKENPFANIKLKKKESKKRILIDPDSRKIITDYFSAQCPQMLLVCMLVYSSQIRPKEIHNILIRDIDLERHCIVIDAENAKNGKRRCAAITPQVESLLRRWATMPGDFYLFGRGETMEPNKRQVNLSTFRHKWDRLREVTGIPQEMQLYSLRDTGIIDMEHAGIDQLTVQHHSDHSSLSVQAIYTDHYDPSVAETIYSKAPKF